MKKISFVLGCFLISGSFLMPARAQDQALQARIKPAAEKIEQKVIAWRRDFHQHPE